MIVIHFTIVTAVLSACIGLACLLAAVVPHWLWIEPLSSRIGPGTTCAGNTCQANPYFGTITRGSCTLNGNDWKDRDIATLAFVWISFAITTVITFVNFLSLFRCHELRGTYKLIAMLVGCFAAGCCAILSMAIFGGTVTSWLGCGTSLCASAPANTTCGYGGSYILLILAFLLIALMGLIYLLMAFCDVRVEDYRVSINIFLIVAGLLAMIFLIVAGATSRWLVFSFGDANIGLFQTCNSANGCTSLTYGANVGFNINCIKPGAQLEDRNRAVQAFLFLPFLGFMVLAVCYFLKYFQCLTMPFNTLIRVIVIAFTALCTFFIFLAIVIWSATYNSWLTCGQDFCTVVGGSATNCNYGFSVAATIIALLAALLLLGLLILELFTCCDLCGNLAYRSVDPLGSYGASGGSYTTSSSSTRYEAHSPTHHGTSSSSTTYYETTTVTSTKRGPPPGDWVWQDSTNYWYSANRQQYYDEKTHQIYDLRDKVWMPAP